RVQKSFLSRSLFPSEYQLPITLRAGGPAAEERRRRKRNCPGSLQ
ncbi:rCG38127, partial [Rattus norvegicus]